MSKNSASRLRLILILGSMTALSPFSIDMYLPAFQTIARDFGTDVARVSLSLSSFFVGLSFGQLIYGPLLDRFGRKRPLYVGLSIYFVASLLCLATKTTESLVAWRFIQALGGCAAGVTSMTMVRDLFTPKESAKIYSLLMLVLGTSPLLAPTIGGYLATAFGWHSIFIVLAAMGAVLMMMFMFFMPETRAADRSVSLRIAPIVRNFGSIIKRPQFYTYVFTGSVAFSSLFVYLAGSPGIFLGEFSVTETVYGWIFAIIAAGLIGASQINVLLLKKFSNEGLLQAGLTAQVAVGALFALGVHLKWFNLEATVALFFLFMCCFGLINSNGAALALAPFSRNAGSAAALMGFIQMGTGALASTCIGVFGFQTTLPIVYFMLSAVIGASVILHFGREQIRKEKHHEIEAVVPSVI